MDTDVLTLATINPGFGLTLPRWRRDLQDLTKTADVLAIQEAKRVDVDQLLPAHWRAGQNTDTPAKAGSVVAWNRHRARSTSGGLQVAAEPGRAQMLTRNIRWQVLRIDGVMSRVVVASAHRPPARYRFLWPIFDARVRRFIRRQHNAGRIVLLGMDTNQPLGQDPGRLSRRLGMRWLGPEAGIIGWAVSETAPVTADVTVRRLSFSDHPAVLIRLLVACPSCRRTWP